MAENNNNSTVPLSDHSPIVEHLRLIHIVIIISCIVVFAFSVFDDSQLLEQASVENRELQKVMKSWRPGILNNTCSTAAKEKNLDNATQSIKRHFVKNPGQPLLLDVSIQGTKHTIATRMRSLHAAGFKCSLNGMYDTLAKRSPRNYESEGPGIKAGYVPQTLSTLVEMWNYYEPGMRVDALIDFDFAGALVFSKEELNQFDSKKILQALGKGVNPLASGAPTEGVKNLAFSVILINDGSFHKVFRLPEAGFHWYAILEAPAENFVIVIPVVSKVADDVNLIRNIVENANVNPSVVKPGSFRQSFPGLYQVIEHKLRESPDLVGELVRKHAEEKTAQVDVLGNKIKVGSILKFGALIIAGLMLYYFLNLRALGYKLRGDNQAYAVAWIGIYPDHLSFATTVLTVVFIPLAVSLLQLKLSFDFSTVEGMAISYSVIAILAIVSAFTLFHSFRVYSKVRQFATKVK